jgi:sec-independent protein translocase protein TatB
MFDVGFWEILFILVLALVIIGPERLPGAARKAGYFVGKARRYIEGVRSEVESQLDVGEFKRMLHNQEVQINELQQQIKSGVDEVKADLPDPSSAMDVLNDTPSHSFYDESDDTEKSLGAASANPAVSADTLSKDKPAKDVGSDK